MTERRPLRDEELSERLASLPQRPGVYLFRGLRGETLYVGKARSLRSRVRSYFQARSGDSRPFVRRLRAELTAIETLVTANEKEAALLENELIKREKPCYNVRLRDDKDYLSLRIDPKAPWPRLQLVRRPKADGARYFGPYESATVARRTARLVSRHFQLRTCSDRELRSRSRPCLQHQIGRCPAPCVLPVDREAYAEQVRHAMLLLSGRHGPLLEALRARMKEAAEAWAFERAARYRDQMRAVERMAERQRVVAVRDRDQDVLGLARRDERAELVLLRVRAGKLVGAHREAAERAAELPDEALLASFVTAWYGRPGVELPDEVLLPTPIEAAGGVAAWLSERRGRKVEVKVPRRGERKRLVDLAAENAAEGLRSRLASERDASTHLAEIAERLRLPTPPRHIECVDVSHLGGRHASAVFVAMREGRIERAGYRSFRVRLAAGGDDYGALREVVCRRLQRALSGEDGWQAPDLLVVDGGRGQLEAARSVLVDLSLEGEVALAGLAKARREQGRERVGERLFVPGRMNPIPIRPGTALALLLRLRDEAHRASNLLRERVTRRAVLHSALDDIPGIGPRTRARLLRHFGSVEAVLRADPQALREAGCNRRQVEALLAHRAEGGSAPTR